MEWKHQPHNRNRINYIRRYLQRQMATSLKKDRENWLVKIAEEMEITASSSSHRLLELIYDRGGRKTSVTESLCGGNESPSMAYSSLDRWTEYFKRKFGWPSADVVTPTTTTAYSEWRAQCSTTGEGKSSQFRRTPLNSFQTGWRCCDKINCHLGPCHLRPGAYSVITEWASEYIQPQEWDTLWLQQFS